VPDRVLRTERLVLWPLTPDLARRLLEDDGTSGLHCADGFPREDDRSVWAGVLASGEHAAGTWLVEHDGSLVGTLGAAGPVSPDGDQEVGYGLVLTARGAGLGLEAVAAVCAVLERRPGVRRLTAEVLPGNAPSLRLLHRLGFDEVDGGEPPHVRLARPAPGQPALTRRIAGRHVC
jgi:ribosomal-protein-alanine N-acetyltransferase